MSDDTQARPGITPCALTTEEEEAMKVARVAFMASCPFYAHFFYSEMQEVFTKDVPMAATDGRRLYLNPKYMAGLKPMERVFVYAHELDHVVSRHPQRFKSHQKAGDINGKPVDRKQLNEHADYVINRGLLETGVGAMNQEWLYSPDVGADELVEDVYTRKYIEPPEGDDKGNGQGQGQRSSYGNSGNAPKGGSPDKDAQGNGGGFDDVMEPQTDPVTGKEDIPSESEFKEAIARAASAAKQQGKMPAHLQRKVDEILQPQVDWREHIRMLMTGHVGKSRETWDTLNRRYAALSALSTLPIPQFPGRKGFGADTVVVAIDTSGSIGEKELSTFFNEVGAIVGDIKPKRVILIWCDAEINRVDEARSLDELADIRVKGAVGGGGTSFVPPFEYLEREMIKPDTFIYLTDLYGSAPAEKPSYPVVWCSTTDQPHPWGDRVDIKVGGSGAP